MIWPFSFGEALRVHRSILSPAADNSLFHHEKKKGAAAKHTNLRLFQLECANKPMRSWRPRPPGYKIDL
jgi:hypothetical protein